MNSVNACTGRLLRRLILLVMVTGMAACSVQQPKLPPGDIAAAQRPVARDTTVALLGGTGFAGSYILREALTRGYPLRVLSRDAEKLAYLDPRVTLVTGDAREPAVLRELLSGADIVISAIGPPRDGGDSRSGLSTAVTRAMTAAMEEAGITRYIVISGAGVVMPGDRRDLSGWWMRQLVRMRYPGILADKQAEYTLLAASGLDWTLVRCPLIEAHDAAGRPEISLRSPGGFYLRAGDLANFVLDEVATPAFRRAGPFLSSP
jgi:putative NADH-flavin reductase